MKPRPIIDTRGTRLGVALAARDMLRTDLADALGVSVPSVTRWIERRPNPRGGPPASVTTERLAAALAIPAAALEPGGPWGPLVGLEVEEQHRVRLELEAWEALPEAERLKRGLELLALLGVDEEEVGT